MTASDGPADKTTRVVPKELFQQVYDSPASLPGKERWVTRDEDVRQIEKLLGMEPYTIGAPLWVSGDTRYRGLEVLWMWQRHHEPAQLQMPQLGLCDRRASRRDPADGRHEPARGMRIGGAYAG